MNPAKRAILDIVTPTLMGFQRLMPVPRGLILCYHSVEDDPCPMSMDTPSFRRQMEFFKRRGYQTITLDQLVDYLAGKISLPSKSVCLTFDDAYTCVYENAFPLMAEYGFTATIFLPTDFVDDTCKWILEGRNPEYDSKIPQLPIMNWDQIRDMAEAGFQFSAHTCSHPNLTELTDDEIRRELRENREVIGDHTGQPSEFICYPYGFYDQRVIDVARDLGYRGGCTLESGVNFPGQDPFRLRRCGLDVDCLDPMLYFAIFTSALCRPVVELKNRISS